MVREVAEALARLGQRGYLLDREDPVFPGDGGWLDGSALRRRFVAACERAELRVLRFHDLRHTFGSNAINRASLVQVQAWMGHVDSRTTMRYLHHKSLDAEADLLAGAFAVDQRERSGAAPAQRDRRRRIGMAHHGDQSRWA